MTQLEIGVQFRYEFKDGDQLFFTPLGRLKNGNWRGQLVRQYPFHKPSKPKQHVVFDPPALAWERVKP